jgi:catechol 2,3-dioxygenase-like lactoylglutathione lyase family enzyme
MATEVRHIALLVPDLQQAEEYYQRLFDMDLIGREAHMDDGLWYTLPPGKTWEDARAAGIKLSMLALRRGSLVLALFPGKPRPGQIHMIGLTMPSRDISRIRKRLPSDAEVLEDRPKALTFRDRYAIIWQIYGSGAGFRSSGEAHGRWLEV